LRIFVSAFCFFAFAAGFLGVGRFFDLLFTFFGATQLFPGAVRLAGGLFGGTAAATLAILFLTVLFGRFYCSSLCPLGTAQDAASFFGHRKGRGFSYSPGILYLRALSLAAVVIAFAAGASPLAGFLDPYSLTARFLQYALVPLFDLSKNLLAPLARNFDLYWLNDFGGFSIWATVAAAATVPFILALAFFRGRVFCNSLCPVGAVLGPLNGIALFQVRFDAKTCVSCGACARVCKAECLDTTRRRLDASRCVSCFSCLATCPTGSLTYSRKLWAKESDIDPTAVPDPARRKFLKKTGSSGAGVALALVSAPVARAAQSLAPNLQPLAPAAPPGAVSLVRFLSSCTACGLCVSKCPSGVLRPSIVKYGPRGFLMPYLDYDASYCQYDCTLCTDLCPTGALKKLTLDDKRLVQMGTAALVTEKCIVFTKKTACGACAEHCPTGSVRMIPAPTGIPEPAFDSAICVGCGACHHICPAEPDKSITVTGKSVQGKALPPTKNLFGNPESSLSNSPFGLPRSAPEGKTPSRPPKGEDFPF